MEDRKRWGPFSGTQLTIIICTVIVTVLFPIGAWAVAGSNSFLTDATSGNQATVANGRLHVDTQPELPNRSLLNLDTKTKKGFGSFAPGTTAKITHVTAANVGPGPGLLKLGVFVRTSGTSTCAQGLAGASGFASGSDYTFIAVPSGNTVDEDFAAGGIPLGAAGHSGTRICPFALEFQGHTVVTIIETS